MKTSKPEYVRLRTEAEVRRGQGPGVGVAWVMACLAGATLWAALGIIAGVLEVMTGIAFVLVMAGLLLATGLMLWIIFG